MLNISGAQIFFTLTGGLAIYLMGKSIIGTKAINLVLVVAVVLFVILSN